MARPALCRTALLLLAVTWGAVSGTGCKSGGNNETTPVQCPTGQTNCDGRCVDLQTDPGSCGQCRRLCPPTATCQQGQCACPGGQAACGAACVDLQTSDENCGGCGQSCGLGSCASGACICDSPAINCPGFPACVDTATNPAHCGSCDTACTKPGERCAGGACTCQPKTDCGTACADLQNDPAHCGACDHACPHTNDLCTGGACGCPPGQTDVCGTRCVDLKTDEANCGACGTACATGATCTAGTCACPAGKQVCGGACVDTQTDKANCGGCGQACPASAACQGGFCGGCGAGHVVCGATCCAGDACCPNGGCQVAHDNGLGQTFFDCSPLDTHTHDLALKAARAWSPSGDLTDPTPLCPSCLCVLDAPFMSASSAAVWCFDPAFSSGFVRKTGSPSCQAAGCPTAGVDFPWR